MKFVFASALAATLMAGTAMAADLVVYDEPMAVMPAESFDWTGFYVGINGGFGGGDFEHPFELGVDDGGFIPLADGSIDVTSSGFLYGVQAGANWQLDNNFMVGIEGDIQGSSIDGRVSVSITDIEGVIGDPGDTIGIDAGTSLDWLTTLRPRIGFVQDRFVVYATGGLAFGQTTSSINFDADVEVGLEDFEVSETNDRFGYTVGAGIEYALTDSITFKTEYLYTDLGTETIVEGAIGEGLEGSLSSSVAFHTVRAGLNFQF